ncbi:hypothetical protein QNA08_15390 [Chelatococcus sp. SYSU_G07232]|uniref:Uncharacterized protein n=1 Tax=Chelatococcus albus TaxID=3047466 RepID=A0ABT7AJQ9_9HYPH|nr:hypothetical protein [Chelatococcus sp. SYSU_G07232]MDJ1159608.1 hypothetical protein [Chelatococcus sp. SYSU_G07232]
MRAFVLALIAAFVVALGASYVLSRFQEPASVAFSTSGVRLSDVN